MQKSEAEWLAMWDALAPASKFERAKALLFEYSGARPRTPFGIKVVYGGGSFSRFFKSRWNTSYGDAVTEVLIQFHNPDSFVVQAGYATMTNLVSALREKLGEKPNASGDFSRILRVFHLKTGVDYYALTGNELEIKFKKNSDANARRLRHD